MYNKKHLFREILFSVFFFASLTILAVSFLAVTGCDEGMNMMPPPPVVTEPTDPVEPVDPVTNGEVKQPEEPVEPTDPVEPPIEPEPEPEPMPTITIGSAALGGRWFSSHVSGR